VAIAVEGRQVSGIRDDDPSRLRPRRSAFGVFNNRAFAVVVIASGVANLGSAMFDTASSWLMTSLDPDPVLVSAVQVATMLPMFLLTIPAGTLADIVDPRRLLIGSEIFVTLVALAFAVAVSLRLADATSLLMATFLLCAGGALAAPAWLLATPAMVPREDLDAAVAINNVSFNISRAVGPAIGGLAIAVSGVEVPFWFYLVANVCVVAALVWWRAPRRALESLPAERFVNAIESGLRYARNSSDLSATVVRALAFFPFASAYWALLPLIARQQSPNGPAFYGILFGALGLGSILGSLPINWLKARMGPDRMAALGGLGTVLALVGFAAAHGPGLALAASLLAGASWIISMTTLFISAQVALPSWVLGRGLAIFLTLYFGAMTFGSALWGKVANVEGLPTALMIASGGAFAAMILTWPWKLQTGAGLDLSPSMHWRSPVFVQRIENEAGPILMTVEYRIAPANTRAFLVALYEVGSERRRDGAYAWGAFEDVGNEGRILETFLVRSMGELRHLRTRVTVADRLIEEKARQFLVEPPKVSYLVAPKRERFARRKRVAKSEVVEPASV
jgi:Na+/melibiose symporter-like transporter